MAGGAVLAVLTALLLGGCDLREGDGREYGSSLGVDGVAAETVVGKLSV